MTYSQLSQPVLFLEYTSFRQTVSNRTSHLLFGGPTRTRGDPRRRGLDFCPKLNGGFSLLHLAIRDLGELLLHGLEGGLPFLLRFQTASNMTQARGEAFLF